MFHIRPARPEDAAAACVVMRRSITELCAADHNDDPAVLGAWLANKTPAGIEAWIRNPANATTVAEEDGRILAFGLMRGQGQIDLNYVLPDARFRGISRTIMAALEVAARDRGATCCTLIATETARRFYHAIGYAETGPPERKFGSSGGYPMMKRLPAA